VTCKRELSMSMVRKRRDRFHISADLLISPLRLGGLGAKPDRSPGFPAPCVGMA